MKLVKGLRVLALSALIFSGSCTSDGNDSVDTVEEENRVPDQQDQAVADAELPSPEQASIDAQKAGDEVIDANSAADVQQLPADQQLAANEASPTIPSDGAGQEIPNSPSTAGAESAAGAESPTTGAPSVAPEASPVAPIAVAEAPVESPAMPAEAEKAPEAAPMAGVESPVQTIADSDVVADSESHHSDAVPAKKAKKAKHSKHASHKRGKGHSASSNPELGANEKLYIVQPGDTLGSIASVVYGSSKEWKSLAELNNKTSKSRIFPGDMIKYASNEKSAAFEARWNAIPKNSVTVAKGDTLSKIAAKVMGQDSYWKVIWRLNQETLTNPNKIVVGQSLQYVSAKDLEAALSSGKNSEDAH